MTGNKRFPQRPPRARDHSSQKHLPLLLSIALSMVFGAMNQTAQGASPPAGAEWTTHGGTLEGNRFSGLTEITPQNAKTLKEEFTFTTGVKGSHMGAPLVVGSTLYVATPYPNKVLAYDLSSGKTLWTYAPSTNQFAKGVNCCDTPNRGLSYADGKIVVNLLDDTTAAIDAKTGSQIWRATLADPHTGVTTDGAPLIVARKDTAKYGAGYNVFVGNSGGEMGVRGWVQSLDLATGKLLWRAYSTGPDADVLITANTKPYFAKDQGKDLGVTSWGDSTNTKWQQGGGAVWAFFTYDPELDLLFYGTSNPGVWNAELRPGDNKWGASIFARKASTGEAAWVYQVSPHDSWDFDAIAESVPVNQSVTDGNGKSHSQLLVHFNKNGFAYTFDRATGQLISAPAFGYQNWAPGGIDLTTGIPKIDPSKLTGTGKKTMNICPSALGAHGWEPSSYSPQRNLFYVPIFNLCMNMTMLKAEFIAGAPYMGQDMQITGGQPPYNPSELIAWDPVTGTKKWGIPEKAAIYGGVLSTAGDVVFYTSMDNSFKAVSAKDGSATGFNATLECSSVGSPISFNGPDGHQRIAVFSGVGWLAGGFSASGKPCASSGGGTVHVYKLP